VVRVGGPGSVRGNEVCGQQFASSVRRMSACGALVDPDVTAQGRCGRAPLGVSGWVLWQGPETELIEMMGVGGGRKGAAHGGLDCA
jgi:hypothetical protein